jgi:hypothetical protein
MIVEIPDEMWAEIKLAAHKQADAVAAQMIADYVQNFVDVTTLDDEGQKLQHVATGKILTVKASWDGA